MEKKETSTTTDTGQAKPAPVRSSDPFDNDNERKAEVNRGRPRWLPRLRGWIPRRIGGWFGRRS